MILAPTWREAPSSGEGPSLIGCESVTVAVGGSSDPPEPLISDAQPGFSYSFLTPDWKGGAARPAGRSGRSLTRTDPFRLQEGTTDWK